MAFHIIQAQHSSPVIVVVAFVFLLHASAQLELDYLKRDTGGNLPIFWDRLRANKNQSQMKTTIYVYINVFFHPCSFICLTHIHFKSRANRHGEKKTFAKLVKGKAKGRHLTESYSNENRPRHPD